MKKKQRRARAVGLLMREFGGGSRWGAGDQLTVMLDFKRLLYTERKTEVNVDIKRVKKNEFGVLRAGRVETESACRGATSSSRQGFQRAEEIEVFISKFACCTKL